MLINEERIYKAKAMLVYLRWDIENNLSETKYIIWMINHIIKVLEQNG